MQRGTNYNSLKWMDDDGNLLSGRDAAKYRYRDGRVVTEMPFTSSSFRNPSGHYPSFGGNMKFTITAAPGAPAIKPYSQYPRENEVLFKSGTRFRVTGIDEDGATLKVHMEQLPDDEDRSANRMRYAPGLTPQQRADIAEGEALFKRQQEAEAQGLAPPQTEHHYAKMASSHFDYRPDLPFVPKDWPEEGRLTAADLAEMYPDD